MAPFVGRVDDLAALREVTDFLHEGAAVAVVVGDPGCGKSRLLAEAAARARPSPSFRVLGYEPEEQVPLAAAADLLRALEHDRSAGNPPCRACSRMRSALGAMYTQYILSSVT